MTVAALILCASPDRALADTLGRPAVRRMVESAWAGGSVPVVVVAADPDGAVSGALVGSSAVLAEPAPVPSPVAQIVRGGRVALERVSDTDAVLVWPGRFVWVDAETVTSLIEAHGIDRRAILRPAYDAEPGWPVLLPLAHLAALETLPPERMADDLVDDLSATGATVHLIELGDPGTTHDLDTPVEELPSYEGPPAPAGGPPPEWGVPAGERSEELPLEGPALAPYTQAEAPGD